MKNFLINGAMITIGVMMGLACYEPIQNIIIRNVYGNSKPVVYVYPSRDGNNCIRLVPNPKGFFALSKLPENKDILDIIGNVQNQQNLDNLDTNDLRFPRSQSWVSYKNNSINQR
jgi:hypothetical protein